MRTRSRPKHIRPGDVARIIALYAPQGHATAIDGTQPALSLLDVPSLRQSPRIDGAAVEPITARKDADDR